MTKTCGISLGDLASLNWHGPRNWNEVGPQQKPPAPWPGRKLNRSVQVQVEKDFSINLLPSSYANDTPASNELILQHEGFPLHPVARKCR